MQWVELKRRVEREREIFFIRLGWPIRNRQAIDQITHPTLYQDVPSSFPYQFTLPSSSPWSRRSSKATKKMGAWEKRRRNLLFTMFLPWFYFERAQAGGVCQTHFSAVICIKSAFFFFIGSVWWHIYCVIYIVSPAWYFLPIYFFLLFLFCISPGKQLLYYHPFVYHWSISSDSKEWIQMLPNLAAVARGAHITQPPWSRSIQLLTSDQLAIISFAKSRQFGLGESNTPTNLNNVGDFEWDR